MVLGVVRVFHIREPRLERWLGDESYKAFDVFS
jgi:hypothetical protein